MLFENLFKPRQRPLAVYVLLTSSVLSTTSKLCFEQAAASFLVCSLIFIEYKQKSYPDFGQLFLIKKFYHGLKKYILDRSGEG